MTKWLAIIGSIVAVVLEFLSLKSKNGDLQASLDNADTNQKDASVAQHTQDLETQNQALVQQAEVAKANATPQELLDFLNKGN